jgi:hypothetical protein
MILVSNRKQGRDEDLEEGVSDASLLYGGGSFALQPLLLHQLVRLGCVAVTKDYLMEGSGEDVGAERGLHSDALRY